ncbi:DUF3800 domain-containing protein [Turicibacter sanguinis]|uniref:DUF3800 domain-containing protein n=1 Tax=Turicibacter sanguinis TaxID=154288 RepID=UPI0006BEEF3F|nr:DUF3800 domain-containing protein [Turicibacter sanguinis]CUN10979.1 Uncharacterised protein [Turicibacter sanguinis]
MNIYVYSDESGVFDKKHNDIYVFGGIIVLGKSSKEVLCRRYSAAEKVIRTRKGVPKSFELKATNISNIEKGKLFRSLNNVYKFGVVINQKNVLESIFANKKSKQRYLDYAYKIGVKKALQDLIEKGIIIPDDVENIYVCVDEHTTATNGRYELKEALEQEFKWGTHNYKYLKYYPPIFPKLRGIDVRFCCSSTQLLVRAADIVANRVYYLSITNQISEINMIPYINVHYLP